MVPKGSENTKCFKKFINNLKGSERLLKVHKGTDRFQSDYYGNEVDRMFFPRETHLNFETIWLAAISLIGVSE